MSDRPSDAEVFAAAHALYATGKRHCWFPEGPDRYDQMDPIAVEEFEGIVEQTLIAARRAVETP